MFANRSNKKTEAMANHKGNSNIYKIKCSNLKVVFFWKEK
jgi:hypothetical protein